MNEYGKDDHNRSHANQQPHKLTDDQFGEQISRTLRHRYEHIHYTPTLHRQLLSQLPAHRYTTRRSLVMFVFASLAIFLIASTGMLYIYRYYDKQTASIPIQYTLTRSVNVAPALANGGHLLSLDPHGKYLIYQTNNQNDGFYTADVNDPTQNNTLIMRDVDDMSWAPDGSALVATINTAHTTSPTLAIASTDKYMHQLGINAMAATWSPNSRQDITYVVQSEGQTQLWNITAPSGQTATMQMTLPEQLLIHCLRWSPDGQYLALIVSGTGTRTNSAQTQTGRSIYILNTMTRKLTRLVAPGNFTIGNVAWSPNGRYLTYEQTKPQGNTLLQSINVSHPQQLFTILPQHLLQGWSWSPDSQALVYSEGGMLQAHVLYGAPLLFSHNNDQLTSPFWLKDGRILCLQITHNKGQLAFLATTT